MIHVGDCRVILPTLAADSVDGIVTDPPYGLGFMGKGWDHAVPGREFWEEALRVAKPGAYLAAFGGTRTFHRLACAIEDAGWELRDTLMWVYGSGFPKSHNGDWGGTALKPAWEPIILARKPLSGTVAANHAAHGTGGLNIDGCRVDGPGGMKRETPRGRWPANLIHDGSDEVVAAFPAAPGQQGVARNDGAEQGNAVLGALRHITNSPEPRGDSGSAARFFYCAKATRADREDGCDSLPRRTGGMVSNTSGQHMTRRDGGAPGLVGNNHPTVKPTELMRWLCRLVTPPGGVVLDPFAGSGSTGRGAVIEGMQFIGIELDPHSASIAEARVAVVQPGLALAGVA